MGLEDSEDSTEDIVMSLIENKLELEGIEICSSRRIGKPGQTRRGPHPILVALTSLKDKK